MYKSTDKNKMKSPDELERDLKKYQDIYDSLENNPIEQTIIQSKITKCIRQLRLWNDLRNAIK